LTGPWCRFTAISRNKRAVHLFRAVRLLTRTALDSPVKPSHHGRGRAARSAMRRRPSLPQTEAKLNVEF
jgi:hypothetical protein